MTIRVLVVDDEELTRTGVVMLLAAAPDLRVVCSAGDGATALAWLDSASPDDLPDVVVTDLRMPGMDGIALTRAVRERAAQLRVLVLTTFSADPDVHHALHAGADGYLLKSAAPRDLAEAVRRLASGDAWLDPSIAGSVVDALRRTPRPAVSAPNALGGLTDREREVLALLAHGLTNAELATRLWVGEGTVKTHVSRILHKTGCRDRSQAIALAYAHGLVTVSR